MTAATLSLGLASASLASVAVAPSAGAEASAGSRVRVLASGLDNPRGLAVGTDGLYIAQSGRGGNGPCFTGPEGETCLGATGKISRIGPSGRLTDVATGLPSLGHEGSGNNAIGPTDVTFGRQGVLYATYGLGFDPAIITRPVTAEGGGLGGSPLARRLASVNVVDRVAGTSRKIADVGAYETRVNPDRGLPDTNPYAIASSDQGRIVTDAGGNSLLRVASDGSIRTLAVFRNEQPVPNPGGPGTIAPQPVPNSIVRGPDGAFYVGQLTGFPFATGTATVWRVVPGQAPTVYADGFTHIIDLAFDRHGNLLVLEIAHSGLFGPLITQNGDWSGALIRVSKDNRQHREWLLSERLYAPGGLAVHGDRIYVSNRAILAGGGQILEVTPAR